MTLTQEEKIQLLELAKKSIEHGLKHRRPIPVNLNEHPESLRQERANFVTLEINGQLRGCIGSLIAHQPLAIDIAHNAFAAAFSDPRFPPLTAKELQELEIHLSILSKPEPMQFTSEEDLLQQLRPGVDGLILIEGGLRGTFLPSVWEQLPEPADFLDNLKQKAGLPADYWSETIQIERYTAEAIP
ncbi:MAG: AmmeMemoRadiSam system protein A [Gammaproteobacteria bacterium]|nr:AmmeMemoRadiSam system protein A [Gammaproteobacteria bacterium]